MAADQRYCLSCGARRGEPRVPVQGPAGEEKTAVAVAPTPAKTADVSPLAAVIGIALLGGMLLIGVLIGRNGSDDNAAPAPIVQVGTGTASTTGSGPASTQSTSPGDTSTPGGSAGAITSEWPAGTDGFTVQISTVPKSDATPAAVDAAKQAAASTGAADAAVLDSDLYSSLPAGNYVIYSGVYDSKDSAAVALKGLSKDFPSASVIEVSGGSKSDSNNGATAIPPAGAENEVAPGGSPK